MDAPKDQNLQETHEQKGHGHLRGHTIDQERQAKGNRDHERVAHTEQQRVKHPLNGPPRDPVKGREQRQHQRNREQGQVEDQEQLREDHEPRQSEHKDGYAQVNKEQDQHCPEPPDLPGEIEVPVDLHLPSHNGKPCLRMGRMGEQLMYTGRVNIQ